MSQNKWLDGMMGLVVGDALGIPVQFLHRDEIMIRPQGQVTGMEGYGTYNMPPGTWSDDGSMALATLSSIIDKGTLDAQDVMEQFVEWYLHGKYTPFGFAFDQGNTCMQAISHYMFKGDKDIYKCGRTNEYSNGNGSLMRILPVCLYYLSSEKVNDNEAIEGVHLIGGLTHNHLRSRICCGFYYFMAKYILMGKESNESLKESLIKGTEAAIKFYGKSKENREELSYLGRLFELDVLEKTNEDSIYGSGYVIQSLESAVWSLLTTGSFSECLLKAVNLGDDTDTVAAIAGGLAGLYYGYESIPDQWLQVIERREWIEELAVEINEKMPITM